MAGLTDAFAQFADFLPEPFLLVATDGLIRAANRESLERLFNGEQVAGSPLTRFFEDPSPNIEAYLRLCSRSTQPVPGALRLRTPGSFSSNFRCSGWMIRSEGADRLILLRLTPKQPAIERFLNLNQRIEQLTKEIALRLHAQQSAHEQREMLQVTLQSIGDAVVTTDMNANVTFMNPVAEAHTGWSVEDALGRSLGEVFVIRHEVTGHPVECPVDRVLRTGLIVGLANHTVLVRKDGTLLPIDDSGAPIRDAGGKLIGVVLVFREIGERRNLERELRRQADALREADKRKDEFLAMLAHELRNPLAPLHNCVQLLLDRGDGSADISALARMMERQTAQLRRLVDDLLDISRITRGMIRLDKTPNPLFSIIELAIETVQPLIAEKGHTLNVTMPPRTIMVNADLARLSQVFCNLLSNAAKFMDHEGLIVLTAAPEGSDAVIRVQDYGVGLDQDLLPHVFDLFAQGDRDLDREHGGLGIGLTLVKALVDMHGGQVSAFSEGHGRGSEFVVRLPLLQQPAPPSDKREPVPKKTVAKRVLIVDDNVDAAESLVMLLSATGCKVHAVHDGSAAIDAARSDMPDAVLLDIGLPGMDGFEVARRFRRLSGRTRPIIIAISGYGSELDRERAREAGFDDYLVKPVDLGDLLNLLG